MNTKNTGSTRQAPFAGTTYQVTPHGALSCPGVSDGAARVFTLLAQERPFCTMVPGLAIARRRDIARRLGLQERAVQYRLAELEEAGFIERDPATAAIWLKGVGNPNPRVQFSCTRGFVGVLRTLRRTPFVRRVIERTEAYIKQWAPHLLKSFRAMYSRAVGLAIRQVHAILGGVNKKFSSSHSVHGSQAVHPQDFATVLGGFVTAAKSGFAERRGETRGAPPGRTERGKVDVDMSRMSRNEREMSTQEAAARVREQLERSQRLIDARRAEKADAHLGEVGRERLKELHERYPDLWHGRGKA